jgi:HK97 family phage portal protein
MKHIPAYAIPGSVVGVSPIGACSMLTSTGAATQKRMQDWFNRSLPGSTFQNQKQTIEPDAAEVISERLSARLRNGKPMVYGNDWKFDAVSMSADDVAFISATRLNATQVATIYGLRPETIGGETGASLTYTTTELNDLSEMKYAIRPWVRKLEQEFNGWIPRPQFVKFNLNDYVSVDLKTRHEVYQIDRNIGIKNADDIRRLEDESPLPDGKGQDYTPLGKAGAAAKETR